MTRRGKPVAVVVSLSEFKRSRTGRARFGEVYRDFLDTHALKDIGLEPDFVTSLRAIAAPVWHETTYGCRRLPRGKRRGAIESYLHDVVQASLPILAYDAAAATWHGYERARLEALGRPVPFADDQIAAIAHANGLALITLNARDFARFEEPDVRDWSKRQERTS